jgi:hypothetical protein
MRARPAHRQAIGPILAAVLFEINMVLPFVYLLAFEFLALVPPARRGR